MEEHSKNNIEKIVIANSQKPIVGAIVLAGLLVAGAILIKGNGAPAPANPTTNTGLAPVGNPAPVTAADKVIGPDSAEVTLIVYEDYQCPFCGKFFQEAERPIRDTYVKDGQVRLVYRDFAFLGQFVQPYVAKNDESINAAQAAHCAGDQGKFWEYHDYLYTHQNGENQGNFSVPKLESFASELGLNTTAFNQCLDSGKYAQAIAESKMEAESAGVTGTPKGYILKDGKLVATIDGAEPFAAVKQKIDNALK
jgi:protein-disulfide isomerase